MKILHTSDWHLGQLFYDYDRSAEQQDMLRQIVDIVAEEQPDAMLISGDIYHTGTPSTAAVEMYNRAMLSIHEACPAMRIVVTAGNHDSASRLVVNNMLWSHFNVDIIGHIARAKDDKNIADFDRHIIEIVDADGCSRGYIAAVPHSYEVNYPSANQDIDRNERVANYYQGLLDRVAQLNTDHLPVVLMAHMAVSTCDMSGHNNIGGMESKDVSIFGSGYDYVALGHIHSPQWIGDYVRYCGTPIPVNFGEKGEHSVSIVDVEAGKRPVISIRNIVNLIPLRDFPTELPPSDAKEDQLEADQRPLPFAEVIKRLNGLSDDETCYLRVVVKVDDTFSPLANTEIAEALKGKKCRFCRIQPYYFKSEDKHIDKPKVKKMDSDALKEKEPYEIADMFFGLRNIELSAELKDMIKESTIIADKEMKEGNVK